MAYVASPRLLAIVSPWSRWAWECWTTPRGAALPPTPAATLQVDAVLGSGLGELVALALRRAGDPRADLLLAHQQQTLATNLARQAPLNALLQAWQHDGIRAVRLKGAATVARWPDLRALRRMLDVDLLVEPAAMATAEAGLRARGARRVDGLGPVSSRWVGAHTWRMPGGWDLDLHRRLHHPPLAGTLSQEVWTRAESAADGLLIPGDLDRVLVVALHRIRSHFRSHAAELMDVAATLAARDPAADRATLHARAERHDLTPALHLTLLATEAWTGADLMAWRVGLPPLDAAARALGLGEVEGPTGLRFWKLYGSWMRLSRRRGIFFLAAAIHGTVRTADRLAATVAPPRTP
jgi:hypothetical protein